MSSNFLSGIKLFASWVITLFLTALICDGMIGGYLHWVEKPRELEITKGLPGSGALPVAHPYKSYIIQPGVHLWNPGTQSIFNQGGMAFDFGVLKEGAVVNDFGHQVLHGDVDIINRPKQKNEIRIFTVGGSTTFQPWPHLLAQVLNRRDRQNKFIAINGGTGGYTSQENVIDLVTAGLSYQPDMVIAYLPVNDIYWAAYYPNFKRDYTHMRIPLKSVTGENIPKPQFALHSYPFAIRFYDWVGYKKKMLEYSQAVDTKNYTTTGAIQNGTLEMKRDNFDKTVNAVIENIQSMKALCEKRKIKFVLVTQKLFVTDNIYYKFMDPYVLKAVEEIRKSKQLSGIQLIEMQKEFPDSWDTESINKVKEEFPDATLNFDQGLAYDSMHFSPAGLHLFAMILANRMGVIR